MENEQYPRKAGEIRPTQILYTYGVGSIIDFPHISALVCGLDSWPKDQKFTKSIKEDRLIQMLQKAYGPQVKELLTPPVSEETDDPFSQEALTGIPVIPFPTWIHCTVCNTLAPLRSDQFKLISNPYHPEDTHFEHTHCLKNSKGNSKALPVPFLVCCENGHLDEFPWVEFVHGGAPCESPQLLYYDVGVSGEMRDMVVKCETCGKTQALSKAFGKEFREKSMPMCTGRRPHLHDHDTEACEYHMRAIQVGSSNLWFPQIFSVISIPNAKGKLDNLVESLWDKIHWAPDMNMLDMMIKNTIDLNDLKSFVINDVWDAIGKRKDILSGKVSVSSEPENPLIPEWNAFRKPCLKEMTPDFRLTEEKVPKRFSKQIEQVVLVERMREVRALTGFSRIYAPGEEIDSVESEQTAKVVSITSGAPTWFPTVEIHGEGIFIQFRESEISSWMNKDEIKKFDKDFFEAYKDLRKKQGAPVPESGYPGIRYVLLHSFSHALMRRLAMECGYSQTSIRERIYYNRPGTNEEPMAGVLIYTAAPDADGTLGGLVKKKKKDSLERHILNALDDCRLCASDPTCAENDPRFGINTIHGAACHSCLFAPETSCERGNRFLDRSVLVQTLGLNNRNFFDEE